ncbi:MAG: hypothetical protein AWM53_01160 [Candidatus Dichloromethanomonas elyunquensis]|nr:MAG: hypothetical protein AWM53_01160 [Candidatus Dichloromethanomonas elyunquensis]
MSSEHQTTVSNLVITLTTLIFAITSMITVFISASSWREERESVKPYLTFNSSPEVFFTPNKELVFLFRFQNSGLHPAENLHIQTMILDCELKGPPLHTDQFSFVNDIPQNAAADLSIRLDNPSIMLHPKQFNPHYIILNLKYSDPVLGKSHEQIIYLKWPGITEGRAGAILHASKEDKNHIVEYLQKI